MTTIFNLTTMNIPLNEVLPSIQGNERIIGPVTENFFKLGQKEILEWCATNLAQCEATDHIYLLISGQKEVLGAVVFVLAFCEETMLGLDVWVAEGPGQYTALTTYFMEGRETGRKVLETRRLEYLRKGV